MLRLFRDQTGRKRRKKNQTCATAGFSTTEGETEVAESNQIQTQNKVRFGKSDKVEYELQKRSHVSW